MFWLWTALLLVMVVRLYKLPQASLPDYDSVRNWQIVHEIAQGRLQNLFHHASPGFFIVFAPVAALHPDFHWFQYLNVMISVLAVGWLVAFIGRELDLQGPDLALMALLVGTAVFPTFSSRDFTMGSLSLLVFVGLLRTYYQRVTEPSQSALLKAVVWLALGLCVNYKFLLTLPILAVLELLCNDKLLFRQKNLWRLLLILASPYLVLGLLGWAVGLPIYRWPATYYAVLFPSAINAAGRTGNVRLDLLYYFWFLIDFELPLLLGIVFFPLVFGREIWTGLRRPNLLVYLAVWAYCLLGGMSLLLKAPRGLLFAYGLFAVLAYLCLLRLTRTRVVIKLVAVLLAVALNLFRIQREVYAYTPSNYPKAAAWLKAHKAEALVSTVGQQIVPYVAPDSVIVITDERQVAPLYKRGYRYVLLDAYWRVAGIRHFQGLRKQKPVAAWSEPILTSPLLFLEHSEFTGLGYEETLAIQRAAKQDSLQLRLLQL
ncbi:hypothetical protein [Hymenobacter jejuensis]|uniref:Glycosyltransferase RgtA/B/C/D-like domain-containing protein n=1 Tax=Hymenobacter jejuensis TaxID=2502781 RepID=A0A5B8A133_9BACT|nr:hypothetical protein [Hymenobacter jejuensis]QDA61094.1 hypothetical protein FHG12_13705 [Hymenobacter jejuensis]